MCETSIKGQDNIHITQICNPHVYIVNGVSLKKMIEWPRYIFPTINKRYKKERQHQMSHAAKWRACNESATPLVLGVRAMRGRGGRA